MSRIAYFDCFSGASGDMLLGALVDAGLPQEALREGISLLGLSGYVLGAERVVRDGLAGTQVHVELVDGAIQPRHLADIEELIHSSRLSASVKERASRVFQRLGHVEAAIHGTALDEVHFHEVGAVDAIIDIVGTAFGMEWLGISECFVSSLPLGHGSVESSHGTLPLPAPATLALLAEVNAPTRPIATATELLTPTGAAILTTHGVFEQPAMRIDSIGVGFGQRRLPWPNITRVWIGESMSAPLETGEVTVIETNVDDSTPEQLGYAMERLLGAGALDVFFTPAVMKKNRPGVVLSVIARSDQARGLAALVLRETSSLGVRFRVMQRLTCPRRTEILSTIYGPMQVKIKSIEGTDVVCPEFEECARVARELDLPLRRVYEAVVTAGCQAGAD